MSLTPRATPVVQPPRQGAPISERVQRKHLTAPIVVVTSVGEWELERGSLIIGRDLSATIVLDDSLVSRFHARITVGEKGNVLLEDLQSANGVFVNGSKISRPSVLLEDGDRLLIGTTEVSVFGASRTSTIERTHPVARIQRAKIEQSAQPARSYSPVTEENQVHLPRRRQTATGRSDAINLVGQFAEQLMSSGHPLEAVRALSEHLQNLLKGASAGLSVPLRILDAATHYALKLHSWTQRNAWLDYILELHLASQEVPSELALGELEFHLSTSPEVDKSFFAYFVKSLERRQPVLTTDEQQRLRRLMSFSLTDSSPPSSIR
jgi:predicted component of type VI protein secretion system